jgi:hypothetical protein
MYSVFYCHLPDGLSEAKCAGIIIHIFNSKLSTFLERCLFLALDERALMITARQADATSFLLLTELVGNSATDARW